MHGLLVEALVCFLLFLSLLCCVLRDLLEFKRFGFATAAVTVVLEYLVGASALVS